jgi:Methyltransferase domain
MKSTLRGFAEWVHPTSCAAATNMQEPCKVPAELVIPRISNREDCQNHTGRIDAETLDRRERERELSQPGCPFLTPGFCFVCGQWTEFLSSWDYAYEVDGYLQVNWREHLLCPVCHLNNRRRASIHLLTEIVHPTKRSRIYATEQWSPLYRHLRECFRYVEGSEYLGDAVPTGQNNSAGIRNEDLTRLSFQDESFDVILCFEVLEHIPDYRRAFAECARILKPAGKMLFSVPFDTTATHNRIRARIRADGTIEHLLPSEYHGHPKNSKGSLCFQHFGWEMLQQMHEAGFSSVSALCYYSREYAYLGGEQIQFLAEK